MKHTKIVSFIVMIAILGSVAGAALALNNQKPANPEASAPPQQMPKLDLQAFIRTQAMTYLVANHIETVQFTANLNWTGGAVETFAPTATYVYNSQGWTLMIQEPLQNGQAYKIDAEYTSTGMGIPYHIQWVGTYQNDAVTETSYCLSQ